jgi:transcriptional regulator with XRE-family HTH domain
VSTKFANWLQKEMDVRGYTGYDLAKKMRSSPATIYRILNGERNAGKDVCKKIAAALKIDESVVFYQAGITSRDPDDPTQGRNPVTLDIIAILENKSEAQQRAALAALEALFENLDRVKEKGK